MTQSKQTDQVILPCIALFIIENVTIVHFNDVITSADKYIHGANKLMDLLLSALPQNANNNKS